MTYLRLIGLPKKRRRRHLHPCVCCGTGLSCSGYQDRDEDGRGPCEEETRGTEFRCEDCIDRVMPEDNDGY